MTRVAMSSRSAVIGFLASFALAACGAEVREPTPRAAGEDPIEAGEPRRAVADVVLPPGTHWISSGAWAADEGAATTCEYLVTPLAPSDALAFFRPTLGEASGNALRAPSGQRIEVQPAGEIPRECGNGSRVPIASVAPPGARAWIVITLDHAPPPCPTCPPGFAGTLVPGCHCP